MSIKAPTKKGFLLVEVIVASAIFVLIASISLGSIVSLLDSNRRVRGNKDLMDNLNASIEYLARTVRFGNTYRCSTTVDSPLTALNCPGGGSQLAVRFNGQTLVYKLENNQIKFSEDGGTSYKALTASGVIIQSLRFYVFGTDPSENPPIQPYVLAVIRGRVANDPSSEATFDLQTIMSQRRLDLNISGGPPPPPPPPTTYRHVRWNITKRKGAENSIQVAELILLNNGTPVAWPGGTSASGGSSPGGEGPPMLIDGSFATKWLDFSFNGGSSSQIGNSVLTIDTGSGNSVTFNGYRWATANDLPARDPISWTISGSNDGSSWTTLDTKSDQVITDTRSTGTVPAYSSDYSF